MCVTILAMLTLRLLLILVTAFTFSGCFLAKPKNESQPKLAVGLPTGKIINTALFTKGGTLVVLPFKAGEDAIANPQLDRVALMIAKGVIDYLHEQKTPYTILTTQDQGNPELVIDGYIHDLKRPGKVGGFILRNNETRLSVSGQMTVSDTKERVMVFQSVKTMVDSKGDGLDVAYQTGQDLGRFIVEALEAQ